MLVTLLIGWVTSQDPEPECWKVLYQSPTSWFLKQYYDESFGIVHNVTALQTLDVRQTNVFLEIQPWQWSEGFLQNYIYRLLDKAFGPYLKDVVVDGSQRVWNEDEMDYDIPQIEADRSGSLEEMLRFQAKYLEDEFTMSEEENLEFQSWVNISLNRLADAKFNKKSNKDIESSLNDNLQKLMNPDQPWGVAGWWYRAVAYNDWTSKMEDRLIKHLKNKAFFQKTEDNPLNVGHDILTFLLINPKVIQSSKIKPLLRMTLSKEIQDTKNISKHLFQFLDCFVAEYGESSLIYLLGFYKEDLLENVQKLKKAYKDNMSDQKTIDSLYWIDLADAVFNEFEALETDDLFYNLYIFALKTRAFLLALDIENKIYPQYQQLEVLIRESYFRLLENPQSLAAALQIVQTEAFWQKAYQTYDTLLQLFALPPCPSLLSCFGSFVPSADILRDFPAVEDVFKLQRDDGQQAFAATQFFRKYRKMNQKSLFHLKLEMFDPRTIVDKTARELRRRGIRMYVNIESVIRDLFMNTNMFDLDWSALETVKEKIGDNWEIILGELEK